MGNRLQPSKLVTVAELPTVANPPIRVRLTGRVVAVNGLTSTIIIQDEHYGLTVDLSSAIGSEEGYLPKLKDLVMITGLLIVKKNHVAEPKIGVTGPKPTMWHDRMVDAILVKPCEELDQNAWRESVRLVASS